MNYLYRAYRETASNPMRETGLFSHNGKEMQEPVHEMEEA
jgi:hypothetical protein